MIAALAILGLIWITVGVVLAVGTLEELNANRPARQAWRMERMDRFHADALADFFSSRAGAIWVFSVVVAGWPYFLCRSLRDQNA